MALDFLFIYFFFTWNKGKNTSLISFNYLLKKLIETFDGRTDHISNTLISGMRNVEATRDCTTKCL